MGGSSLVPHQNLEAFFGSTKRRVLSNRQSITVTMNIFTKPEAAPSSPAASMPSLWDSATPVLRVLPSTHTKQPATLRFGHFPKEQNRAGPEPGLTIGPSHFPSLPSIKDT